MRKRCDTWLYGTDLHWSLPYPRKILHNLHFFHAQAWRHAVKVLVKGLSRLLNLHWNLRLFVKVLVMAMNLHRDLKLVVKVVTVVKVFGGIRKKNSV